MLYMMNPVLDDKERKKNEQKRVFIVEDLGWFSFKSKKIPNLCNPYQIQTTEWGLKGSNVCEVGLRMLELMNANRIVYQTKIKAVNKEHMGEWACDLVTVEWEGWQLMFWLLSHKWWWAQK
jgi:hypothetical protein